VIARTRILAVGVALAVVTALFGGPRNLGPQQALALGVFIEVNTASDTEAGDGFCSLREAIHASNGGGYLDCDGSTSMDSIRFNIGTGTPVINVSSELPEITAPVTINGNSGGATRVRVHGPNGSGTGLDLGSSSDGSTIKFMQIDNFLYGIFAGSATATIVGNVISGNNIGIFGTSSSLTIGGVNAATATEKCGGDCNLVTGNSAGMYLELMQSYSVKGNFIGVNALGAAAQANNTGIFVSAGVGSIGGSAPGERNVISGNTLDGLKLFNCQCSLMGNYIGTDVTGKNAIANGASGVWVRDGHASVGGTAAGEGNLISGNTSHGIYVQGWAGLNEFSAYGNRIGVKQGGGALANGGDGIQVHGQAGPIRNVLIGSASNSDGANTVAFNGGAGVRIRPCADRVTVRGNSIHSNSGQGIVIEANPPACLPTNGGIAAPSVTGVQPVTGTACTNCMVDVYSDSADEGRTYEGSALSDGTGQWELGEAVVGPNVTATATDGMGNTSAFSAPFTSPTLKKPDGRIRKGSGPLVGNNVYNTTGVNQTRTGSTTRGNTITFNISIQNDAGSDRFKVLATGSATNNFTITYFRNSTDITAAVVAGTYTTPVLAQGATFLISAKVKVKSTATAGSSVTRLVTISSVADASKKDAVKLVGKRS
jgi:CSLREA domain-containing protein